MAIVNGSGATTEPTTHHEANHNTVTESLYPSLLSRVQEPEGSDGSVYDIEILAQSPGASH